MIGGRFVNADDVEVLDAEQDHVYEHNLYCYCLNNPVNMGDDDGKVAWFVTAAFGGALFESATYAIGALAKGKFSWQGLGKAALTGAVTGVAFGAVGKVATKVAKVAGGAIKSSRIAKKTQKIVKAGEKIKVSVQTKRVVKSAQKLKYTKTALIHMPTRPYMKSTLAIQQIMRSTTPMRDKTLKAGLKWVAKGSYNKRKGYWELVVDSRKKTIVHYLFRK